MSTRTTLAGAVVLVSATAASADILIDQPADYVAFFQSDNRQGAVIQVGDDYLLPEGRPVRIDRVSFTMAVTWPNTPVDYAFEIYRTVPDDRRPWRPRYTPPDHRVIGPSQVIDRGEWKGGGWNPTDFDLHETEVVFDDLDIILEPGVSIDDRWFFSPMGLVTNQGREAAFLATSGDGELNWSEGWFKLVPFTWPGWVPIGNIPNRDPSDYAMTIEGTVLPAPGALAPLGLAFLLPRRRRRSV